MSGLDTSATGMQAQQLMIDVISHNLANMNTTAFKRQLSHFKDLMYMNKALPTSSEEISGAPVRGMQIGLGVKAGEIYRVNTTGGFVDTGNDLDLAIRGAGYFVIDLGNGEIAYTRDGSLSLDRDGNITTSDGFLISPNISIPPNSTKITIGKTGQVDVLNSAGEEVRVGQIEIARFINEGGLVAMGDNLFSSSSSSGDAEIANPGDGGYGTLAQHYVESSNVDPILSITNLIRAQRAYEMNAKALQANSEVKKVINDIHA